MKSETDLNRIDDTIGGIRVEGSQLSVNDWNFDRQTHTLIIATYFAFDIEKRSLQKKHDDHFCFCL